MKYEVRNSNGQTVRETNNRSRAFLRCEFEEKENGYAEVWSDGKCLYKTGCGETTGEAFRAI